MLLSVSYCCFEKLSHVLEDIVYSCLKGDGILVSTLYHFNKKEHARITILATKGPILKVHNDLDNLGMVFT